MSSAERYARINERAVVGLGDEVYRLRRILREVKVLIEDNNSLNSSCWNEIVEQIEKEGI
jgi:hypothetical protein